MPLFRTIQWKALLMLTVFAVNFMVVCHCSAQATEHTCCAKKETRPPCKDDNGCSGVHAVKFNLLEKQASSHIELEPVYVFVYTYDWQVAMPAEIRQRSFSCKWLPAYSPPDSQSLYQCFRI